ncbi:MAG: peptidoglycan-binding domain-containing protein [Nitrososphaeraceae archaeon]
MGAALMVHPVVQGEFLARIASKYGFTDPMVIWNRPENKVLRDSGRTPTTLAPGDKLFVPELTVRELSKGTETRHRLVVKQSTHRLRVALQRFGARPAAGMSCTVRLGGETKTVKTDGEGKLEVDLPSGAELGELEIDAPDTDFDRLKIPIRVGHLDPIVEISGQEARLNNLGYRAGTAGDRNAPAFRSAVEEFQCDEKLPVDGVCGVRTQAKLKQVHGC